MGRLHQISGLGNVPDEIVQCIIDFLDDAPPSATEGVQLPSLDLLRRVSTPLKALSLVSRRLRRIVFPTLFRHVRLGLDSLVWTCSPQVECGYGVSFDSVIPGRRRVYGLRASPWYSKTFTSMHSLQYGDDFCGNSPSHEQDALQSFCQEIKRAMLDCQHSSLTVYAASELDFVDRCYLAAVLWDGLFEIAKPHRVVIVAPPRTLASLFGNTINDSDSWAFNIPYQRLLLRRNGVRYKEYCQGGQSFQVHCKAKTSILNRGWTSFEYDAGSCLNAYGTYHYFEKTPPCMLSASLTSTGLGKSLQNLSYSCIFPHFAHIARLVQILRNFEHLEHITLQLVPDPRSDILNDHRFVGRGNLSLRDCWSEVERSYVEVVRVLLIEAPLQAQLRNLRHFTSRDCSIQSIRDDLDAMIGQSRLQWTNTVPGNWIADQALLPVH